MRHFVFTKQHLGPQNYTPCPIFKNKLPSFGLDTKITNSLIKPLRISFGYWGPRTKKMNARFSHHNSYDFISPTKNCLVKAKKNSHNLEFL